MKRVVHYWERDTLATFESGRARLLDLMDKVSQQMRQDSDLQLLTGGEAALMADVAELRPDLQALLVVYNAASRLTLGPWFIQPPPMLVSGESLIRNLLAARASTERYYGITLATTAMMSAAEGYPAQLPQILRGFGIDSILMGHGANKSAFRWQASDGSAVLALKILPTQPFAFDEDTLLLLPYGQQADGETIALADFIQQARHLASETFTGELYPQIGQVHEKLHPGMFSNRLYLKQANAHLQAQLSHVVEPLLALALTHGRLHTAANLRPLLAHSWRTLLRNQPALTGASSDAAHAEHEAHFKQVADVNQHIIRESLHALPGTPGHEPNDETCIVVWNPHNWQAQQIVEVALTLPQDRYPARLTDVEDREIPFVWSDKRLSFAADVPPVGYTTYALQLADSADSGISPRTTGTSISHALGDETLAVINDQIVWRHVEPAIIKDGEIIRENVNIDQAVDLLRFFDGGDAGDAFNYSAPELDMEVEASLVGNIEIEQSRLYERMTLRHRLRVAPALNEARERVRGVKSLEITTTATLYHHIPGIYFHTTFENTVDDHRLRVHVRTGLNSAEVIAGSAFGLVRRKINSHEAENSATPDTAPPINTRPMRDVCAVDNSGETMALLARGLPEYEAITENGQVTLALTLLRAVGWRSRDDLQARAGAIDPMIATPDAQCHRPMTAAYALVLLPSDDPAALLRAGQLYAAPLLACQYAERPPQSQHSYLTVESDRLLLTALKPPESGNGWIVRLLNPTDAPVKTHLQPAMGLRSVQIVNMAEEPQHTVEPDQGRIPVTVAPHQILTLLLRF